MHIPDPSTASRMRVAKHAAAVRAQIAEYRLSGATVALVPTMGALHAGHMALVDEARRRADRTVVSIFVNPLQFGLHDDLTRYPRDLERDSAMLRERGVDLLFVPEVDEMYPYGPRTTVVPPPHAARFEGSVRPAHFTGVLTVVAKLFNIVSAQVAVFGQKDLQQLALVRGLVRDLDFGVEIAEVATVREPDGLAMSSRNSFLDSTARVSAARIHAALGAMRAAFAAGERRAWALVETGRSLLTADSAVQTDYLAIVDPADFEQVADVTPGCAAIVAARVSGTRLIDNIIF